MYIGAPSIKKHTHAQVPELDGLDLSLRGVSALWLEGGREGGAEGTDRGSGRGEGECAGSGVPTDDFRVGPRAAFFGDGSGSLSPGFLTCPYNACFTLKNM